MIKHFLLSNIAPCCEPSTWFLFHASRPACVFFLVLIVLTFLILHLITRRFKWRKFCNSAFNSSYENKVNVVSLANEYCKKMPTTNNKITIIIIWSLLFFLFLYYYHWTNKQIKKSFKKPIFNTFQQN